MAGMQDLVVEASPYRAFIPVFLAFRQLYYINHQ